MTVLFSVEKFVSLLGQFQSYSKSSCTEQIKPIRKLLRMGSAQRVVSPELGHFLALFSDLVSRRRNSGPRPLLSSWGLVAQLWPSCGLPCTRLRDQTPGKGEKPVMKRVPSSGEQSRNDSRQNACKAGASGILRHNSGTVSIIH